MSQKLIDKANALRDAGKTRKAVEILGKLINSQDDDIFINANISIGICYANMGFYEKAVAHYNKAMVCVEKKDHARRGSILRDAGIALMNGNDFQNALIMLYESMGLFKKIFGSIPKKDYHASIGITASKLGLLLTRIGDLVNARNEFLSAFHHLEKTDHEYWKLIANIDYCEYLIRKGQRNKARERLKDIVPQAIIQKKGYKLVEAYILMGDAYSGKADKREAKMWYLSADGHIAIHFTDENVANKFNKIVDEKIKALGLTATRTLPMHL